MSSIGRLVKKYRTQKNLTQWQIAMAMGYSTPQFISNIESGRTYISPRKAMVICKYLGASREEIVGALNRDDKQRRKTKIMEAI